MSFSVFAKSHIVEGKALWVVRVVMVVLVGVALSTLLLIFTSNPQTAVKPSHVLHLAFTISNPLPRDLDRAMLTLKLPSELDASLLHDSMGWGIQIQAEGEQLLVFTPAMVKAFANSDIKVDVLLSPRASESMVASRAVVPLKETERVLSSVSVPAGILTLINKSDSLLSLDKTLKDFNFDSVMKDAYALGLSKDSAPNYFYLIAMMKKAQALKLPMRLLGGWAFDKHQQGAYTVWLETGAEETLNCWSPGISYDEYHPAEIVDVSAFLNGDMAFLSPFFGRGLEIKSFQQVYWQVLP